MDGNLSEKHLLLLSHLRQNSREKLTIISKKTNIPISTLFDMLKEMQGVLITKSTVFIDYARLGFHTRASILLRVSASDKEKLQKHLRFHPNINTIYKINNSWDFLIETIHKNNKELDIFLDQLHRQFQIQEKQVHYLIDEIKKEESQVW